MDDLKELLLENEISNFDPVAEAYKIFDPRGEGSFDGNKLRAAFVSFGFGQLSDEEFEILKRVGSHAFYSTIQLSGDIWAIVISSEHFFNQSFYAMHKRMDF